jgi:hypothetical protein
MSHIFIPYSAILHCPYGVFRIFVCGVEVELRPSKTDRGRCTLSLPVNFLFDGLVPCHEISMLFGTVFELEYNRRVCEVIIGTRFDVKDAEM